MPNIPDITPEINLGRCETINLLLNSIALEEIALSHIINAEGEKLQLFLCSEPKDLKDMCTINDSINKTLRTIVKSQMLLQFKLEDVMALDKTADCNKECRNKCNKLICSHCKKGCKHCQQKQGSHCCKHCNG